MKRGRLVSVLIAGGVIVLMFFLYFAYVLRELEDKSLDYRFRLRGNIAPDPRVVIVDFDEASLNGIGKWPWPRKYHGQVVERLSRAGAKAILFDMLVLEPDTEHPENDARLVQATRQAGNVVFDYYYELNESGEATKPALPLPPLRAYAAALGFANVPPETDGVVRKIPLFMEYRGQMAPSFALSGLAVYLKLAPEELLAKYRIPLDYYNQMTVNFTGYYTESFPHYSFQSVLAGQVPDDKFKDKIVLLGGTALGLFDSKTVPFGSEFPGVEVHANAISNILQGNYLRPVPFSVTFILIVLLPLFSWFVMNRFSPLHGGLVVLGALAGYSFLAYYLFAAKNLYLEYVPPTLSLVFSYVGMLFHRFMSEEKEKRWIKSTFSHYLSAHVMESILSDPDRLRLGGQRKILTVLFSDIRGFTTISEALAPEEVVELLNEYLSKMVEVVFRHDGTLDKFIGDAVMAFWGAPLPQEDHPRKAVLCAVEMIEELMKLQEKWRAEGKKVIDIGIGVNTGEMVVGNMGSKDKMEYTIIGDNVNLGSRLEGLNKEYKTRIIISDATYRAVKDLVEAEPLGAVKVKGKANAVEIYAVTGRKGAPRTIAKIEAAPAGKTEEKKDSGKQPFDPDARMEFRQP